MFVDFVVYNYLGIQILKLVYFCKVLSLSGTFSDCYLLFIFNKSLRPSLFS